MDKYCYECHDMAEQKEDIRLDYLGLDLVNTVDSVGLRQMYTPMRSIR